MKKIFSSMPVALAVEHQQEVEAEEVGAEEEEGLPLPPPVLPQEPLRQQNLHLPLPAASKE
jgi:hypothetical protein